MVVAAGVGYENAETSTITVKTYDAETGAILSDETYELNVREDAASADSQPSERIFAGGVGPGADGLSAFTLRVYDSATGRFLWEGLLNLSAGDQESSSTHRVVAHLVAPQATVTQVRSQGVIDGAGGPARQFLHQQNRASVLVEELTEAQDLAAIVEDFAGQVANVGEWIEDHAGWPHPLGGGGNRVANLIELHIRRREKQYLSSGWRMRSGETGLQTSTPVSSSRATAHSAAVGAPSPTA